ncbi:anaphase-promoting complex subunit 5-like [Watersipora subatra]|uniref:anaphase-promoting complex subunit 5-like n=1 Tax=Watersipora subatra TaxID=2589382 RepID=UPI00355C4E38
MSLAADIRQAASVNQRSKSELNPSTPALQDTVTPYRICVLILIRLYLEEKKKEEEMFAIDPTIEQVYSDRQRQATMLLFIELLKVPDMSINQLFRTMNNSVPEVLHTKVETAICELAEGKPCAYYQFFERLNLPIGDTLGSELTEFSVLNKTSVVGMVVRSTLVVFKMLSLEELLTTVIADFIKYSREITCKRRPEIALHSSTLLTQDPLPSRLQAERRVAQLAIMLEQNTRACDSATAVGQELNQLIQAYPFLHKVHYVRYLNQMRVREYAGAKESLHRYYDKIAQTGDRVRPKDPAFEDSNKCSRFASLSLASFYARFGHKHLALHSVKEAVKLAQEADDNTCLQHSLIWLEKLSDVSNFHNNSPGLTYWELSLTGCLIKTLQHTAPAQTPKLVFEELAQALSYQTKNIRLPIQNTVKSTTKLAQMMLTAGLWSYYGNRSIPSLISHNVLHTDSSSQAISHCAESECLALCTLSNRHFYQGRYECAESILNIAKENFCKPYFFCDIWCKMEQCQLFDRALYHSDTESMRLACDNLSALDPTESAIRRARYHMALGQYQQALNVIEGLLALETLRNQSFVNTELKARVLLEMIHLYIERDDTVNAKKYINECRCFTSTHQLIYQHALCHYYSTYIQLMNGNAEEGYKTMTQYLPCFLIHGSCFDKGRAQVVYTKCKIAQAKSQSADVFTQAILEGLQVLGQARDNLRQCEAFSYLQDVLMYMALLCNMLGDTEQRNSYAFQYRELERNLATDIILPQTLIM